jgi:hypothetical protein
VSERPRSLHRAFQPAKRISKACSPRTSHGRVSTSNLMPVSTSCPFTCDRDTGSFSEPNRSNCRNSSMLPGQAVWPYSAVAKRVSRQHAARNNEPAGNIGNLTEHDAIVLIYRSRPCGSTEWKDIRQRVPITWTECHLGGRRPWFRCTVYAHGRYCGRRVATIYHAGDVFACRHCLGLAYGSQQEPVRERGIATARKIRMGLGGGESLTEAFPELRRRHDRAFARSLMGLAKSAERLERWVQMTERFDSDRAGQLQERSPSLAWRFKEVR